MEKKVTDFNGCLQPINKTIVSCRDKNGEDNALAVAYICNCSFDPPMIMAGIVPSRYSHHMVKNTGVYVVNLVPEELEEEFNYLGSNSGRNENKLEKLGLTVKEATKINAPLLTDFPVNIECEVVDSIVTGSHEMFVGKVKDVHTREELIDNEGKIDFSQINFLK